MSYVAKTLGQGERILYEAHYHWTYTLAAWVFTLTVIGAIWGIPMLIASYTTEIVVTSRRFVKKTGLIVRRAEELSLDRIEEVNLRQSVLGRLLNYGDLTVRGTGEGVIDLVMVDDPIRLRRELQSADTR